MVTERKITGGTVLLRRLPIFTRGCMDTLECVLYANRAEEFQPAPNLLLAIRAAFSTTRVRLKRSTAMNLPVVQVMIGPHYRRCGRKIAAAKLADLVSRHYGSCPVDVRIARVSLC